MTRELILLYTFELFSLFNNTYILCINIIEQAPKRMQLILVDEYNYYIFNYILFTIIKICKIIHCQCTIAIIFNYCYNIMRDFRLINVLVYVLTYTVFF